MKQKRKVRFSLPDAIDFNGWRGGGNPPLLPTCRFSLNNSNMVKAVTLVFCSIQ